MIDEVFPGRAFRKTECGTKLMTGGEDWSVAVVVSLGWEVESMVVIGSFTLLGFHMILLVVWNGLIEGMSCQCDSS